MSKFLQFSLFLTLAVTLANAASMMPAEHSTCVNASFATMADYCSNETSFYFDQNGKCGCLSSQDITLPNVCASASIRCDEAKGQVFSSLYKYYGTTGLIEVVYAGCGCFTVAQIEHATMAQ